MSASLINGAGYSALSSSMMRRVGIVSFNSTLRIFEEMVGRTGYRHAFEISVYPMNSLSL